MSHERQNAKQETPGSSTPVGSLRVTVTVIIFAATLLAVGALRYCQLHCENPPAIAAYATPLYVAVTVFAVVRLIRSGVSLDRLGFGLRFRPVQFFSLALLGVLLIQGAGWLLTPAWENLFGSARDLERFSGVAGSPSALIGLLALNWTFAAFGEELAFRIVLMGGIAHVLGNSRNALMIALILQAIIFGLVHAYQGPAGGAGSAINGLIFGGLVLASRGSIWPAAIAHGLNNTIGILALY